MKKLDPDWITQGILDFEYKKYLLLAYLKEVEKNFNESKLYPFLSDLIFHYRNLLTIKKKKEIASRQFPKKISRIDFQNFRIEYERLIEDDDSLNIIEEILDFAIPKIEEQLHEGKQLYEFIEKQIHIYPVGVIPVDPSTGYMFVRIGGAKNVSVYAYNITIFENAEERFRGIKTQFINSYEITLTSTLESLKTSLLKQWRQLTSPAAYAVETPLSFPLQESVLPVAKRRLVRMLQDTQA